jgi:hemolysin activation/secretion protein
MKRFLLTLLITGIALYSGVARALPTPLPLDLPAAVVDPARIEKQIEPGRTKTVVPKVIVGKAKEKPMIKDTTKLKHFVLKNVKITGSTVFSAQELKPLYQKFLHKSITINDLNTIINSITHKYSKAGYVLCKAVLPIQKIANGVVRIQIIEGRICNIYIEGEAKQAIKDRIAKYGEKIKSYFPVKMKPLERCLLLINDLPGINVKTVLSPKPNSVGGINLIFIVKRQVITTNVIYDNYGTRYLGPERVVADVAANSLIFPVDQFGVRVLATTENSSTRLGQLFYKLPLFDDGLELDLMASNTKTHPGFILTPYMIKGISNQITAALTYPFIRSRTRNLDISLIADWLDSNSDTYLIVPLATPLYRDKIRSLRLKGHFDAVDRLRGINVVAVGLSKGLPILGASSTDPSNTLLSRAGGKSNYTKVTAYLSRLQRLDNRLSVLLAFNGQYSWDPLLSVEEFGFGGRTFGRGYDPSDLIGDRGVAAKAELRFDTHPELIILQDAQYYTFYDYGKIWNIGNNTGQVPKRNAASFGAGMRINFTRWLYGSLEFSRALTYPVPAEQAAGKSGKNYRAFFSIAAHY